MSALGRSGVTFTDDQQQVIASLVESGFTIDRFLEPLPTDEFKTADPEECDKLMHRPGFLCVRVTKGRDHESA